MTTRKRIVLFSFIWKFLERISVQIVSFIVTIVLARMLTPDDFGTITLIMVFINLASVFVEGGLNSALIQKDKCDHIDYSTIFCFTLVISILLYLVLYFSAPSIANFYSNLELCNVIRVISIGLLFYSVNSIQNAYLVKNMMFKKLFLSSLVGVVFSAIIGILLAYKGYGIWSLIAQYLLSSFVSTIILLFIIDWRPSIDFSINRFKSLFSYGWKIFLSNIIITIFNNIRSLIIGKYYTVTSLAYYEKGRQFPTLIMDNINNSIQSVMFPVMALEQSNLDTIKMMMRRATKISSYVIFPLLVLLIILARPLTILLLTDKWIGIVPFIQIFCIGYIMMPIQNVNIVAIKALGYSNVLLKLELIKKIIGLVILFITLFISVEAIAWGVVVYNFLCIGINLYPTKKLLSYSYMEQFKDVFPSLMISFVMGMGLHIINNFIDDIWVILSSNILFGMLFYMFLSKIFNIDSFNYLLSSLTKQKR